MIFGIDPGLKGAISVIDPLTGELRNLINMPVSVNEKNKSEILAHTIYYFVSTYAIHGDTPLVCAIENVHAMPKQGVSSMFSFGYGYGLVIGVMQSAGCEIVKISPQTWKRHYGLIGEDKKAGLIKVDALYPNSEYQYITPRGRLLEGRVDAVLIGRYYYERNK